MSAFVSGVKLACARAVRALNLTWLALMCSGCYLAHGLPAEPGEVFRPDASRPASDAGSPDAGPEGPLRCTLLPRGELLVAFEEEGNLDAPDIFWTGERIGVVVHEDNAGEDAHGVVSLSHVDLGLTEATPLRTIGEDSHGWGEAAWNGDGFGLCWSGDPGGVAGTKFREVSGLDGPLGPRSSFGVGSEACLDLVFGHDRYAATWRQVDREDGETMVDSLVGVLERDGTQVSEPFNMGRSAYGGFTPSLAVTDAGFTAVSGVQDGVRIVNLGPDGVTRLDRRVEIPGAGYTAFALGDARIALATLSGSRETRSLTFRVLDADLREVSSRVIIDGAPTASRPRVLARPEGWLIVWGEGSRPSYRAMMLSVDADGRPLAPRQELHRGQHSGYGGPSLISVEGDVFVGISHQLEGHPEYSREYTHVQRWTCEGAAEDLCRPQDAEIVGGGGDCARGFLRGWRFDGRACVPLYDCDSGCRGADCDRLSASRFACESDRRECLSPETCELGRSEVNEVCGPLTIPSGRANWLDVSYGGDTSCPCERPTCEIVPSGPLELSVTLSYCVDDVPDCDCSEPEPERPSVSCALPPLAPGTWTLHLDGRAPTTIESERGEIAPAESCR